MRPLYHSKRVVLFLLIAVLTTANDYFDLNIPPETITKIIALAASLIIGDSIAPVSIQR